MFSTLQLQTRQPSHTTHDLNVKDFLSEPGGLSDVMEIDHKYFDLKSMPEP